MKVDPVDPMTVAVMGLQLRRMAVGKPRMFLDVLVAGQPTEGRAAGPCPGRIPGHRGPEHRIAIEGIEADRGLRLVVDLVGGVAVGQARPEDRRLLQRRIDRASPVWDPVIRADGDLPSARSL